MGIHVPDHRSSAQRSSNVPVLSNRINYSACSSRELRRRVPPSTTLSPHSRLTPNSNSALPSSYRDTNPDPVYPSDQHSTNQHTQFGATNNVRSLADSGMMRYILPILFVANHICRCLAWWSTHQSPPDLASGAEDVLPISFDGDSNFITARLVH